MPSLLVHGESPSSSKIKSPATQFHHSEISKTENGGLIVEHHFRPKGEEYGPHEVKKLAFGPGEHQKAYKSIHSQMDLGDWDSDLNEKDLLSKARAKTKSHLKIA